MGFIKRLIYATLVSKEIREARVIDEIQKIKKKVKK